MLDIRLQTNTIYPQRQALLPEKEVIISTSPFQKLHANVFKHLP